MTRPGSQPLSALSLLIWPKPLTVKGIFPDPVPWIGAGGVPALQEYDGGPGQEQAWSGRGPGWKRAPLTLNGPGPRIPTTPLASSKKQLT